jgi:secretion/DNA translocation related CpaE-like protein
MTSAANAPGSPAVLVLTRDGALLGELRRLAAAAGALLDVVADPAEARSTWALAPAVLVGAEVLAALAETAPTRREQVHVVAHEPVPDALFRTALAVGAETVVELPAAETWLVETLTDTVDGALHRGGVVGVVGGCGGAGATTFAAALAAVAARDLPGASDVRPVVLVDADPLGPGIEQVTGLDDLDGARWGPLLESTGRLGSRSLLTALPRRDGLAVLGWGSGPRPGLDEGVAREVLNAAQRGSALVVLDLPRCLDPATVELLRCCDDLVLVTTLTLPAVTSTAQVAARALRLVPRAHLVARGPTSALDPEEVATALGLPLAAVMSDQRRLAESVEIGLGPLHARRGPLARAARSTLEVLA